MGVSRVPGFSDLVMILIVVLVIFGASLLPQIATSVGRSIQRFRQARRTRGGEAPGDEDDEDDDAPSSEPGAGKPGDADQ